VKIPIPPSAFPLVCGRTFPVFLACWSARGKPSTFSLSTSMALSASPSSTRPSASRRHRRPDPRRLCCALSQGANCWGFRTGGLRLPPRDLLFRSTFVPDVAESLRQIAAAIARCRARRDRRIEHQRQGRPFFTPRPLHRGAVAAVARKVPAARPTDVFDEDRYSSRPGAHGHHARGPARRDSPICEDIWTHPMIRHALALPRNDLSSNSPPRNATSSSPLSQPWHSDKAACGQTLVTDARPRARLPARVRQRHRPAMMN